MTEEVKETELKECKCFCCSERFKKFLTIAIGTFVGVYCALSLFAAVHKPPMIPPCGYGHHRGFPCKMIKHHHMDRIQKHNPQDFRGFDRAPFEINHNENKK